MDDKEQKVIFSRNLNRLLSESGKTQREVADSIHVLYSTFNTWCQGVALPRMGKVQLLADYFSVPKSALIDDISADSDDFPPLTPPEKDHIRKYRAITDDNRQLVDGMINTLLWQKEKDESSQSEAESA